MRAKETTNSGDIAALAHLKDNLVARLQPVAARLPHLATHARRRDVRLLVVAGKRLVDARRDVAVIIRESGFESNRAMRAITELIAQEMVEKWDQDARVPAPMALK